MDDFAPLMEAFGMLDIVLAVFGALIVSMWFGRGKKLGGLLWGALAGGLIKPALFLLVGGGVLIAAQGHPPDRLSPEQQDKLLKYWTK